MRAKVQNTTMYKINHNYVCLCLKRCCVEKDKNIYHISLLLKRKQNKKL